MAHFLAEIHGTRGPASRLGSKKSGITATAASWQGAVNVMITHDETTGKDIATVSLRQWHGAGSNKMLWTGPVDGREDAP